uniref:UBC core domain-containing protein n=1 Tax=Spongospora subterranea TaxID=70186 RepID=A0A0H5QVA2_9EUKA|eukprot:CRZ05819.1 hypothetical protein [Spongospora subterranea]
MMDGNTKSTSSGQYGAILLRNQLKELMKNPVDGFSVGLVDDDNMFEWQIMIEGPAGTMFEGGLFPALLKFPLSYPNSPPVMTFQTPDFWHPNVYPDGRVCISILHEAKVDNFNQQELMEEKWRPILGVESILVSVVSLLSDPNFESPANIDASINMQRDPEGYRKRIRRLVRRSVEFE